MKRLLFVTNESSHGGAEKMLIWLANQMSRSGKYKVFFYSVKDAPVYYPLDKRVSLIKSRKGGRDDFLYRNTVGLLSNCAYIRKIIKKNKIDCVINFNDHAIYNILLCKLFTSFKLIVSQRVDPFSILDRTGKIRLSLLRFANGLVCQTESALEFFKGGLKKRGTVINNPVYNIPDEKWNEEYAEDVIINVARIELKQKRQDVLIKAFAKICNDIPGYKLKIFGAPTFEDDVNEMKKLIASLKLKDRVEYCGITDDVMSELRKSKLFVLSSDFEGIPNSVIEAMSIGMPIVSTDCKPGGARLLLDDGSGVITPIGDSDKLAEAMKRLILDREEAKRYGAKAAVSVKRFEESAIASKWIKYIDSIIKKR